MRVKFQALRAASSIAAVAITASNRAAAVQLRDQSEIGDIGLPFRLADERHEIPSVHPHGLV